MTYALTRTSMALDQGTLQSLNDLAQRWSISKAEVMRRAIQHFKEESDRRAALPEARDALAWLQNGGGITLNDADNFRQELQAERQAKVYWWEEA